VNESVLLTKLIAPELLYYRLMPITLRIIRNIYNRLIPIPILVVNDLALVIALFPLFLLSRIISRLRRLISSISLPSLVVPRTLLSKPKSL
jgi:hypothetical protein